MENGDDDVIRSCVCVNEGKRSNDCLSPFLAAVNDCLFGHEKDLVPLLVAIQNRGVQTDRGPNRVG